MDYYEYMIDFDDIKKMNLDELFAFLITDRVNEEEKDAPLYNNREKIKEIYKRINVLKENGDGIDIKINDEEKKKLYLWARNNSRYMFLSKMIGSFLEDLLYTDLEDDNDDTDYFLINNLMPIMNIIEKEIKSIVKYGEIPSEDTYPKVSKEETIRLSKEILLDLDPSSEWLKMYEEMLDDGRILYYNEMTRQEVDDFYDSFGLKSEADMDNASISVGNESYIMLNYQGHIKDVSYTIHEMIHNIKRVKCGSDEYIHTLDEFFSIFYQVYALEYLSKIGYDKKSISDIEKTIFNDNSSLKNDSYSFFLKLKHYVKMYVLDDVISEEKDIEHYRNNYKLAHLICDTFTNDLLMNENIILMKYHYLIGNYLTKCAIDKMDDREFLDRIKYFLENSLNIDPYDIFELVGIDVNKLGIKRISEETSLIKRLKREQ